jgi:hypothetical protein
MRSPATRLTLGAAALIATGAAVFSLARSEAQIATFAASVRRFDLHARETADALAELRLAQQAYVAAGQGVDFWMPKVAATAARVKTAITLLRQSARSGGGRLVLMEAEATLAEFQTTDSRAREYLESGDRLMAADVIFLEGGNVAATAARQVETARLAEQQGLDADEAVLRKHQRSVLAAAAGITVLIVFILIPIRRQEAPSAPPQIQPSRPIAPLHAPPVPSLRSPSLLGAAADLCTEFGRIRDVDDLKRILARTAEVMQVNGLIVWLGSTEGADLQPVVMHGYSPQAVARMPAVPRSADNAAAAAYRTGLQQIVLTRPGQTIGAIVAPILTADGCIGALSAEMRAGTEGSEAVQTLATIVAAHLAGVFAASASSDAPQKPAQALGGAG